MICPKRFKSSYTCDNCENKSCPIRVKAEEEEFNVLSEFEYKAEKATGLVIDIGTTTIAAISIENGNVKKRYTALNRQRHFGADVISRIDASNNGHNIQLQRLIRQQVSECVTQTDTTAENIIICANTAMTSFFMGYECKELGVYPFKAQSLETVSEGRYTILGGISGFVGGDITAGMYMCGFDTSEAVNMFIDLGTNGELAIGNKDKILCTSVAAGPAFEGGNISCGSGAVSGAITSVSFKTGEIKTIADAKPQSICGSGIIELMAELIKSGSVDESGLLTEEHNGEFLITEGVSLTQSDIRNIQTAKSAVRTGIEIIINEFGVDENEIGNIYISGGFSKYLDIEKACVMGLLPRRLKDKYKCVGNSALGGGVKVLENGTDGIEKIRSVSKDFSLAENKAFNDLFMKYMYFN